MDEKFTTSYLEKQFISKGMEKRNVIIPLFYVS